MPYELTEKQALQAWTDYLDNIRKSTALLTGETEAQQRKRIAKLEADNEEWFKYYFPSYSYAEPADFHKQASKRVLNNLEWYEVRMWSRELAKSTRTMMEVLKLCLTGKKRYILLISNSLDNASAYLIHTVPTWKQTKGSFMIMAYRNCLANGIRKNLPHVKALLFVLWVPVKVHVAPAMKRCGRM